MSGNDSVTEKENIGKIGTTILEDFHRLYDVYFDGAHRKNDFRLVNDIIQFGCESKFFLCPGSSGKHHCFTGGLAQHTYEVISLCMQSAASLENMMGIELDKRLLFFAALTHDVGKTYDYKQKHENIFELDEVEARINRTAEYFQANWYSTDHKDKIRHIYRSATVWEDMVDTETWTPEDIEAVTHAILAHHQMPEWGSPIGPKTDIAWILHLCDNMSAKVDGKVK